MTEKPSSTFCPVPWGYLFTSTNGDFRSCVAAYSSQSRGLLKDQNENVLNVSSHTLEQVRNSKTLCELRKNMLSGLETPSVCQRCIDDENKGLVSRRHLEKINNFIAIDQAKLVTNENGILDCQMAPLRVLDIKLGNRCNLACRMCGPTHSSSWYEEWYQTRFKNFSDGEKKQNLIEKNGKIILDNDPYHWIDNIDFWNSSLSQTKEIREIHFSGGEPLLLSRHTDILNKIIDSGFSNGICLTYNTNLTVLPDEITKLWRQFKFVRIGVSIDGVEEVNNYIRHPSRFQAIEKNLHRLNNDFNNVDFWLTTTLSILNIGRYTELIDWIVFSNISQLNRDQFNKNLHFFLSFHMLRSPEELNIQSLPDSAKVIVEKRILHFIENRLLKSEYPISDSEKKEIRSQLIGVLEFMNAENKTNNLYRFYIENQKSDLYRKQSFNDIDPEVARAIKDHITETGQYPQAQSMAEQKWWR